MARNPCGKCCNTNPKNDPLRQLMKSPTTRIAECQHCARRALARVAKLERLIVEGKKPGYLKRLWDESARIKKEKR